MTLSTWEHPLNKKRRLNRTAFREATKNTLPRDVVNKIFSYKEAANYLRNIYPHAKNQVRNAYTRWLANSNSKMNMNTSEKLEFIDKSINSIGHGGTARYINLVNSKHQLSKLTEYLRLVGEKSPSSISKKLTEREFVRKFLKQNDTTTKKIFNVFRNHVWNHSQLHKIVGLIGNRGDMLKILKGRLNQTIQEKQKMVNTFEKSTAVTKKRPRTRGQMVYLNAHGRVLDRLKTDLSNIKRQKSNLQNLATSTLRNKIKRLE